MTSCIAWRTTTWAANAPAIPLQTTALVNEAYIRLIDWKNVRWQSRAHFFGGIGAVDATHPG